MSLVDVLTVDWYITQTPTLPPFFLTAFDEQPS